MTVTSEQAHKRYVSATPANVMSRMTDEVRGFIRVDIRRMFTLALEREVTDEEVEKIINDALRQYVMDIKGHRITVDRRVFYITVDPEKYMLSEYGEAGRQKMRTKGPYPRQNKQTSDMDDGDDE